MEIRSATALRNDYDGMVRLSKEKQTPIFLTRNGDGEMVFLPIELWEKREAELNLLAEMLRRERSMLAGSRTSSMEQMAAMLGRLGRVTRQENGCLKPRMNIGITYFTIATKWAPNMPGISRRKYSLPWDSWRNSRKSVCCDRIR